MGYSLLYRPQRCSVTNVHDNEVIFKGFRYQSIYLVDFTSREANLITCLFTKSSQGWLWHRRLAHIGMNQLKKVFKSNLVRRVKHVIFEKDKLYGACQARKQVRNIHPYKNF